MKDPATRVASRVAALVALPVALVAGIVAYRALEAGGSDDRSGGAGAPARPRSSVSAAGPAQAQAPVEMPQRALADRAAGLCRALSARLPDHLGDLPRRTVTAGPEQNAAYGDPPVTVACGAVAPSPPANAQYFLINGVCWHPAQGAGAAAWSLQKRAVPLIVTVPQRFTGQYLVDLAGPVSDTIPPTGEGCGTEPG